MGVSEHTYDPGVLYKAKKEIIEELNALTSSPRIYVQINPNGYTPVRNGSMVELLGWAEPGSEVIINGNEVKVNPQGLFLFDLTVSQKRNSINVKATSLQGSREIFREFKVY